MMRGRTPKLGKSQILRRVNVKEQVIARHNSVPGRVPIADDRTILLDTNVVLGAVGFNGTPNEKLLAFVSRNKDRTRLYGAVKSEVDLLMANRGTDEMYRRLVAFEGTDLEEDPDCSVDLSELEARQRREIRGSQVLQLFAKYL